MEAILLRQQQLEETNRQLCEKAGELRRSLRDLDISQDRYQELRDLPDDKISIQEYVAVSMVSLISTPPLMVTGETRYDAVRDEAVGEFPAMVTSPLCCVFRCVSMRW